LLKPRPLPHLFSIDPNNARSERIFHRPQVATAPPAAGSAFWQNKATSTAPVIIAAERCSVTYPDLASLNPRYERV